MVKSQAEAFKGTTNKYRMMVINREVNRVMKSVKTFLEKKAGGNIPPEWSISLTLLETYLRQFLMATKQLEETEDLLVEGKRGPVPNALLNVQAHAATRLEKAMSELGLSLKSSKKLGLSEPKKDETALDAFFKTTMGMESTMEMEPEEDEG